MMYPTAVQTSVDNWAQSHKFVKQSGSWYHRTSTLQVVLQAQKSQYGPQYYLNVGLWFPALGQATFPKVERCHVYGRIEDLVSDDEADEVDNALDMDVTISDFDRDQRISTLLTQCLVPLINTASPSIAAPFETGPGRLLLSNALIQAEAREFLSRYLDHG